MKNFFLRFFYTALITVAASSAVFSLKVIAFYERDDNSTPFSCFPYVLSFHGLKSFLHTENCQQNIWYFSKATFVKFHKLRLVS